MKDGGENSREQSFSATLKQILVLQTGVSALLLCLIALSHQVFLDAANVPSLADQLKSSLYGSVLAIAGTILSARSVQRATKVAGGQALSGMVPIFAGLLNKLVIVGGGIAFGLIVMGLEPLWLVIGYAVTQLSTLWVLKDRSNRR